MKVKKDFRLEEVTIGKMDELANYYSEKTGLKVNRTSLIELLIKIEYRKMKLMD